MSTNGYMLASIGAVVMVMVAIYAHQLGNTSDMLFALLGGYCLGLMRPGRPTTRSSEQVES